jgi:predicted RNA-binding protein with RPS1 domain
LYQAKPARIHILSKMKEALSAPRPDLSPYAPRITSFSIKPDKIREVIGAGGKIINEIIASCPGVKIDIEDDGLVMVTSTDSESSAKAVQWIKDIVREVEAGEVFEGKVTRIMDFGAFVEVLPGKEGLVHISQLANYHVAKVEDVVIIYNIISGTDDKDSTTIKNETYKVKKLSQKPVIGIPRHFLGGDGIDKDTMNNFNESLDKLKSLGYEIKDINLPNISYSLAVYYVIMPAEVSSNLSRFDGVRFGLHKDGKSGIDDYFETRGAGFGKEARRRILLGTYVLSSGYYDAYYNRANAVRRIITQDFVKAFENVDIILTPTTPAPAFKIGEKVSDPVAIFPSTKVF